MLDITGIATALVFVYITIILVVIYGLLGYFKPGVALVTVPFVALAIAYAAILLDRVENLLFAPVLLLMTLIVIAVSNRDPDSREWAHRWASSILIAIASILLLVAVFVVFHAIGAGAVLPLFFALAVVAIIACLIGYGVSSGRTVAFHVISTLHSSMRQNLPLPMALDCAASGRDDRSARIFRRIKKWLVQGHSLTESIKRGYRRCPSRTLALLAVGERLGQLPAAFEAVRADMTFQVVQRRKLQPIHPLYPVVVIGFVLLMILGFMVFVMPVFEELFAEMIAEELPGPTRVLFGTMRFLFSETYFGLLLFFVPFFAFAFWLRGRYGPRRPEKPYLFSRIGDFLKWHLPVLHWFENNHSTLQVVELLRLSLSAGCPVDEAIAGTLELDVNVCFKKRLKCWHERVVRGDNVAQAARNCGLGTALAWAFDTSIGSAEAPAVLEMLESFYRTRYSYRVNLSRFIFWPCAIIAVGLVVGFVVVSLYLPAISLIDHMVSHTYP